MAVKFKPKPGKPHIKIQVLKSLVGDSFFLAASGRTNAINLHKCWEYCSHVNPDTYSTPGEAARALHYWSKS